MAEFRMPSLGADMDAGTLVKWRCAVGDRLERGDIIAEVETDKGIVEVEVYEAGVVEALLVERGTKVPVGTSLALLREGLGAPALAPAAPAVTLVEVGAREDREAARPAPSADAATPAAVERERVQPSEQGVPAHATPTARRAAREQGVELDIVHGTGRHGTITVADVEAVTGRPAEPVTRVGPPDAGEPRPDAIEARDRLRVSPLARRRAAELGVALGGLQGTGPEGSIVLADVERAASATAALRGATPVPSAVASVDPKLRMRQAIAASMARSKREIPHYYASHTIDLEPALTWLERENAARGIEARLLPAVFPLHAVVRAVQRFPELNGHYLDGEARPSAEVHLGVAIALRGGGLVAPAILSAQSLGIDELMQRLTDLVARARSGKLRASEMGSATITVTSLGDRGVEAVFPVIVPPQVAMVGFGTILKRPFVVGDELRARRVITASLAADHRVSDGHRGGLFLAAVAAELEKVGAA